MTEIGDIDEGPKRIITYHDFYMIPEIKSIGFLDFNSKGIY
jgi:hypothetical protein